jgi:hypothetical protein
MRTTDQARGSDRKGLITPFPAEFLLVMLPLQTAKVGSLSEEPIRNFTESFDPIK